MIISQEELERRLGSSKNLSNSLPEVKIIQQDRKTRSKEIDPATKIVASILHKTGSKADLAELNLSPSQIQNTSPKVKKSVSAGLERIQELAIDKMMDALGLMTPEKFENASLKDLSAVTRDMSRVIENTREKNESGNNLQIIIHAPSQKSEDAYLTVDV